VRRAADGQAVVALQQADRAWWPCAATRAASTPATSGCTSDQAGEFNIQQMDVQTYFFRRTNMNALGQPRSWTDHLLWHHAAHTVDLFATRPAARSCGQRHPGPDPPDAGHRDGHEHPAQGGQRRDLHAEPELQQRRPAGHLLPLHRRHRHLHRALRRPVQRQGREDRRQPGRRVDERHRAAGPRVLRRHPRRPRAQRQRGPGAALLPGAAPAGAAAGPTSRRTRWTSSRTSSSSRCTCTAPA
jgi:hypothetical protein